MNNTLRHAAVLTGLLITAASIGTGPAQARPAGHPDGKATTTRCSETATHVNGTFGNGAIRGTLCTPKHARTLQLLLHGYTYDRHYWDFPYRPAQHSYVDAANKRGYATLAIDRLGSGESTHPLSPAVTYQNNARTVHQVIQAARNGDLGRRFDSVILVGHSYGSITSYLTAGKYKNDVDAVIATGAGRGLNIPAVTRIAAGVRPSILDPKFTAKGYDPGYVTLPRRNHALFFNPANVDPTAAKTDYAFRQASSLVEITTGLPYSLTSAAKRINVPVLTINGSRDEIFCGGLSSNDCTSDGALARSQKSFFGDGATVEGKVIPGAGHSFNVENNAAQAYASMLDFSERHVQP